MRTPKRKSLASADLTSAWEAVFETSRITDAAPLRAAGWRTVREIAADLGLSYSGASRMLSGKASKGLLDRSTHKVDDGKGTPRTTTFYRPKSATARNKSATLL
jgi:predicted ArsR family transcriptional regulator